jgi:hypothetical protein
VGIVAGLASPTAAGGRESPAHRVCALPRTADEEQP